MNPKNEPLRLSVTAARERDNPRGRVESIRADMKTLADCIHAEQRHKPGWTPAPDYRVVAKADVYRGRDYEALLKAALKPPVGYWEDAPRGLKFGGTGGQNTVPVEAQKPDAAPSSDPYEPVGTVPVVGDRFEYGGAMRTVTRIDPMLSFSVRFVWGGTEDGLSMHCWDRGRPCPLRILKRQKAPQAQAPQATNKADYTLQEILSWGERRAKSAPGPHTLCADGSILPQARAPQGLKVRAWRGAVCDWVVAGGRYYVGPVREWRGGQWERSNCDDSPMPKGWPELPAPEALELWKACATALRLNFETGEPL